jgi:ankyrin repeat protein
MPADRFRWVFCQLEVLLWTLPAHIRNALNDLPKSLDETYARALLAIDKHMREDVQRLFQCLAVSLRPLRVEDLADILAIRFDSGALPIFDPDCRLDDAEEAVISACSNLVSAIDVDGSRVFQFSHFSVKEFLTSDRLATSTEDLSRFYIVPHSAHTTLAQACLGVLLHLDDRIDKDGIKNFPLSEYAAKHWVEHAQFGNVPSSSIQAAMEQLFNPHKPHFSAWVWIYDMDDPRRGSIPTIHPERPQASPLYYAVLCGFRGLIEHLVATYPMDVDATGGYYGSPLLAAVIKEDIETTSLLLRQGADINIVGTENGWAPLHFASLNGRLEALEMLLGCGADITVRGRNGETPLDLASGGESAQVVSFLVKHGTDVTSCDNNGWTPLHTASKSGNRHIVQLLLNEGADVDARNADNQTPLALASESGAVDVSRVLIERGAYVNSSDDRGWTSLCSASRLGHLEVVRLLLDYGADANSQGADVWSPLHLATVSGHLKIAGLLIQHGADVDSRNPSQETALNLSSRNGELEIARLLLKCGSKVNSQDNKGWAPLHSALRAGDFDIARLLLEWGADIDLLTGAGETPLDLASGDGRHEVANFLGERKGRADAWSSEDLNPSDGPSQHWQTDLTHSSLNQGVDESSSDEETTPMHVAARRGHLPVLRSLLKQGTHVDERNANYQTSLDVASSVGRLDVVSLLIDSGADVNSRCDAGWTPLHRASKDGHLHIVRLLLNRGAKVNVREQERWTPLHLASYNGYLEIVHLLLERGADVHARNFRGWAPLHAAATNGHFMITQLLSEYGAHEDTDDAASPRELTPPCRAHYAFFLSLLALLLAYILRH